VTVTYPHAGPNPQPAKDGSRLVFDLGREVGITYLEQRLSGKLYARRAAGIRVPGIEELNAALHVAGSRGPIPARVCRGTGGQDDYLRIYVDGRYAVILNATNNGRGYLIGDIYPLGMKDQDEIVRGGFALAARSWRIYRHPGDLPQYLNARWAAVKNAWRSRPRPDGGTGGPELPASYARYLDDLQRLVDKAREIELSGTPSDRMCRYQRITPAAVQRRTAQSVYKFQAMGGSRLAAGTRVHIDDHPDLRGEVTDIRESLITVRFDQPIDFNRIPQLGGFVASPNTTSLDKQAEAIEILREQRGQNPRLLDALVGHSFQPFRPVLAPPRESLDDSQRAAFQMALAVPDLGLVQGPPGTGKTRTIKQVVWEHAAQSRDAGSVLVSAHTNQAVDNVLKGLPDSLTVIRVGSGVTKDAEHLTLEAQASCLQQRILDRTQPGLARYAKADPEGGVAVQRLRELDGELARLDEAAVRVSQVSAELEKRDAEITAPLRAHLEVLTGEVKARQTVVAERGQWAATVGARQARAAKTASIPVLGRLFRGRSERLAAEAGSAASAREQAIGELASSTRLHARVEADLGQIRATDPGLAELQRRLRDERESWRASSERSVGAAQRFRDCLDDEDAAALPVISTDPAALARFRAAGRDAVALAQRRLLLLRKWRGTLERRTEQLYPELVRYADVVGATCIGAASSRYISDVTFGLAIIDEAGQISTPNLLVPLVRARRAVLVGDHVQLPPYAERELADWAAGEAPALAGLAAKSAFELLFPYVPEGSRKMLSIQRRMPRAIADYISAQFYGGRLGTDTQRAERDELFASTIAFIDTAELPAGQRRERSPRAGEPWPRTSHLNDIEARLITDLVAYYDARGGDWVVIVPFSAQEGLVSTMLANRLGDEERVAARVASVDSFQGGEHDTVIFGFTRSNSKGAVGFFKDTRRSNVAFSRARQRLIMIGDLSTLCNASDPGFRSMMTALCDHLRLRGDPRGYREVSALLAGEAGR
jgi:hypothetical protein